MHLSRRSFGAVSLAGLSTLAGCSALTGGSLSFEAKPAGVPKPTQKKTGYQQVDRRSTSLQRTFAGQEVNVTNWITEFQKSVELANAFEAKLGVFVAFTTPAVKVAGQGPFNPVANVSTSQLIKRLQGRYSSLKNAKKVGSMSAEVLGSTTTVDTFSATTTYEGREIELRIHITKQQHEEDFVIPVGVYPKRLKKEEEHIVSMMNALEHPVEP